MEPTEQTAKQQTIELLRSSQTFLVTTGKNPSVDAISSVIGLTQMLDKMSKRTEAVISSKLPKGVHFLPTQLVHDRFSGLRDFVIELDTSRVEADKLKYIPEGGRLKIFITPFNGNFNKEDLGFSYGDYHCDAVLVLGANGNDDVDTTVADQKDLLAKTKVVFINAGTAAAVSGTNILAWSEPQASSLSEMMMSLTEALASGILDNHIATSLLTGIIASTNHFTGPNTTPKVMTMAAQLLAAGGDQATIVRELGPNPTFSNSPTQSPLPPATPQPSAPNNEDLAPSKEQTLPHRQGKPGRPGGRSRYHKPSHPEPQTVQPAPVSPPPLPPPPEPEGSVLANAPPPKPIVPSPPPAPSPTLSSTPMPPLEDIPAPTEVEIKPVAPPPPPPPPPASPFPSISDVRAPVNPPAEAPTLANDPLASEPSVTPPPAVPPSASAPNPSIDVEEARRRVAEAADDLTQGLPPV